MASASQVKSFIATIAPIAQRQAKKHGYKIFVSVCIAQACCESAFGTSPKMIRANAVFGIKVGKSKYHFGTAWKDKAYSTKTKECYDGKTYQTITDMFRAYDSLEDAVEDYFDLLCTAKRYRFALDRPTPRACIEGIQKAPYATSPTYVDTIMNIISKYRLTQYDSGSPAPESNPYPSPTRTLKNGMRGDDVKWLQWELTRAGLPLTPDGIFGPATENAVRHFQNANRLVCDGLVGPRTISALMR